MYDSECLEAIRKNKNMLVPWYLMASYAYYKEDDAILQDSTFDELGRRLFDFYDKVEHMHKHHITKADLKAGTYLGEYPGLVVGALNNLRGKDESSN